MAKPGFRLFWSNIEAYEQCPQMFLWGRGWEGIDLGRGPGRSKESPVKQSEHHTLLGNCIQGVLERFYNDELWREPESLADKLQNLIDTLFDEEMSRAYINWNEAPSRREMYNLVKDAVFGFMNTFKTNNLLGPYAKSEVEYNALVDENTPIAGRFDFLIHKEDEGVIILDGKNSKTKGKYTNPDQLRWYALAFYLSTGILPSKLGFVYFRYPAGYIPPKEEWPLDNKGNRVKPEPHCGIDWVSFTPSDLTSLAQRAKEALAGMKRHEFQAKPVPSRCKFCNYESVCPERIEQKKANSRSKIKTPFETKPVKDGIFDMEEI
jgi:hypothetical protein